MTNEEWMSEYHSTATRAAGRFPVGMREDAYQDFAVHVLEYQRNPGNSEKKVAFVAKMRVRRSMGRFLGDIRVTTHGIRQGHGKFEWMYLDSTLPEGESYHEVVGAPGPDTHAVEWRVLERISTKRELRYLKARYVEDLTQKQAVAQSLGESDPGYGSAIMNSVRLNLKKYIEAGYIRERVKNERKA